VRDEQAHNLAVSLEVAIDPDAPPANILRALARLLRALAERERREKSKVKVSA
jgi:hypothetical protein